MTPERWQQADELLQAVLAQPPEQRAAFLDEACADDAELPAEVSSLLRFHGEVGDFLNQPPIAAVADLFIDEPDARAGQTLSHYQLTHVIGRGGVGEVYLARDTRLDRRVALKFLPARFVQDLDRLSRFRREARAASGLNHPNILTIHEIGEVDGAHVIAAEYVEGQTWRALIKSNELKLGAALDLIIQVASALAVAHQAGIIHRNIKPENLMLRPDGFVKVLDFGLAKLSERAAVTNSPVAGFPTIETDSGVIMGTVSYMSPEQGRGQEVDWRTDLFSLGIVLYELLTGQPPFTGLTTSDVLAALLNAEPEPLRSFVPQIPEALQHIVSRLLAKDRAQRYQRATELLDDLKQLKQELELNARKRRPAAVNTAALELRLGHAARSQTNKTTSGLPVARRTVKRRKLRVASWTGVIVLAALIVLGASWGLRQWFTSPSNTAPINSLAVLPFANALNDPQMNYLPDGITESLIQGLAQLPDLKVMARATVFTYKGREVDPRQVGAVLNVRAVITGSVTRQGEQLIIRAELVDAQDGARLWGEQYQRPLADLLALQETVAREISIKLRPRLTGAMVGPRPPVRAEAYQLGLKGNYFHLQFTPASLTKALDYFQQAIALDPNYAMAYTGLATAHATAATQFADPREHLPQARQAALRALQLDAMLAEAHFALALVHWWADWDWQAAEQDFQRAIQINPNYTNAHAVYGDFLANRGRFDQALAQIARALETDPLSLYTNSTVGRVLFYARQYERALAAYHQLRALDPDGYRAPRGLGRYDEAIAELQQSLARDANYHVIAELGHAYARAGRRAEAVQTLDRLRRLAQQSYVSPIVFAKLNASLGDKARAFAWLRRAYAEHSNHLLQLRVEPAFDNLRADARFAALLRATGLAP